MRQCGQVSAASIGGRFFARVNIVLLVAITSGLHIHDTRFIYIVPDSAGAYRVCLKIYSESSANW